MIKNRTAQLVYQTVYCTLGIVGCIACLGIFDDIKTFRWDFYVYFTNLSNFLCLGVMFAALGIVLVLGQVTHGSKISYTIAGVTLQPSEFVKIIFVFFVASLLYKKVTFAKAVEAAVFAAIHVLILVVLLQY